MPFLRFTRDKRGYETTALVHAIRRQGRSQQRILYWFRTPPGVKVGRPALDQDAIRWIEDHNPDIEFDWPKILEAQPPPAAPAADQRGRRSRQDRPAQRPRPASSRERPPRPAAPVATPAAAAVEAGEARGDAGEPAPAQAAGDRRDAAPEPANAQAAEAQGAEAQVAEAIEQLMHPDAEEMVEPPAIPIEQATGREQLVRLRARYAELQARITERGGDAERVEALRSQAESLNPDAWVTDEEVRKGLEEFEPRIRDLRGALGLRRRRRSRRGGQRRTNLP